MQCLLALLLNWFRIVIPADPRIFCHIFHFVMFIFLLCLLFYCNKRENIATPSGYIFVFGNEVLIKIIPIFPLRQILNPRVIHFVPIYPPGICLRLSLQSVAPARRGYSMNRMLGRQKIYVIYVPSINRSAP